MSLEREVLLYRSEARQKSPHAFRNPEATHAGLAFTLGLMASIFTTNSARRKRDLRISLD